MSDIPNYNLNDEWLAAFVDTGGINLNAFIVNEKNKSTGAVYRRPRIGMFCTQIRNPMKPQLFSQLGGSLYVDEIINPFNGKPNKRYQWRAAGKLVSALAARAMPHARVYRNVLEAMVSFSEFGRSEVQEKIYLAEQIRGHLENGVHIPAITDPLSPAYLSGLFDSRGSASYIDGSWLVSVYLPNQAMALAVRETLGAGTVAPGVDHDVETVEGRTIEFSTAGYYWSGANGVASRFCRAIADESIFQRDKAKHIAINPYSPL